MERYSRKFNVKVEQFSIQYNHIHLLVHANYKSNYQNFFRVFAGQVAQVLESEGLLNLYDLKKTRAKSVKHKVTDTPKSGRSKRKLWAYRPFTRVIKKGRVRKIIKEYITLNELEALKVVPYRKTRLKGLSSHEWELIREWS